MVDGADVGEGAGERLAGVMRCWQTRLRVPSVAQVVLKDFSAILEHLIITPYVKSIKLIKNGTWL